MERISQDTTLEEYAEWLEGMGYEVKLDDKIIIVSTKGSTFIVQLLPSNNLIFRVPFLVKENVDEFQLLRKTNEINRQALSGCFSVDGEDFAFLFSLIKPFGMGREGFKIFVEYNLNLLGFMLVKSGIQEFVK